MEAGSKHPTTKDYVAIFVGLLVLTAATVMVSYAPLGEGLHLFVAFAIATVKALLVALIFMHLRYEPRMIVYFAVAPILLAILFILAIAPDVGIAG